MITPIKIPHNKEQQNFCSTKPLQNLSKANSNQPNFWQAIKTVMSWQNQAPPLVSIPHNTPIPLSFSQERLWYLHQLEPTKVAAYNMPFGFHITGTIDVKALENSFNEILKRHETLRTTFQVIEEKPCQIIHPSASINLTIIDLQQLSLEQQQTKAMEILTQNSQQPFELEKLPLLRAILIKLEQKEHLLLLNMHHIITDAWSKGILFQELASLYQLFTTEKSATLSELSVQYADFSLWQRQWLEGEFSEVLQNYWKEQLKGINEVRLPTDHPRPILPTRRGAFQKVVLPQTLTEALKTLSRQQGATLFATLLAAFKVLLHSYTQQEDLYICSPIANRNRKEIKPLIGYFVNLLILRTDLSGNPSFLQLLKRVRQVASEGYAYQDLPIQQLLSSLNLQHIPLSRIMFAFQNTGIHNLDLPGLTVKTLDLDSGTVDFDLYLYLLEDAGTLNTVFKYNTELFDDATIIEMLKHFQTILENIVTNPDQPISALLPLSETQLYHLEQKRLNQNETNSKPKEAYIAPRNSLELKLVQLWIKVLGIPFIGVKDNFFELGGHSLLAVNLSIEIEKAFGKTISLSRFLQAPTIEQLATIIAQKSELSSWSSLTPIQANGTKPPFFCVHGQLGTVFNLKELANYLGSDQPFYGLQAQGLDGKKIPYFRIENMAAQYIKEIRTVQPEGPYFIGGNSMGGTVAFEIAQQLGQKGQKIGLLAMFDTFNRGCFPRLSFRQENYLTYLLRLGISQTLLKEIKELLHRKLQENISKLYLTLGFSLPTHLRRFLVAEANMQAKSYYTPQIYPGKITLFRASEPSVFTKLYLPTVDDWYNRNPQHGWTELASGGLEIYDVPGDHFSLFKEPHVQVLAQKLKACLNEALLTNNRIKRY